MKYSNKNILVYEACFVILLDNKIQLVFNYLLNDILQNNCKKFERLYS